MTHECECCLMLRFRDLVTEPGGNIAEHQKIIRQQGGAWWGWWSRQREHVPRITLERLFGELRLKVPILLFDSGMTFLYITYADRAIVAPSLIGINSPDFEATPDYYVRGRYFVWFHFCEEIQALVSQNIDVIARPSIDEDVGLVAPIVDSPVAEMSLDDLREEPATMWVTRYPRSI